MKRLFFGSLVLLALAGSNLASGETRVAGRTLEQWAQDLSAANETVRLRAAKTIGQFGAQGTQVAISMLSHDDAAIRYWAATHLGDIGKPAASARPGLEGLKQDESPAVRMAIAYALCGLGEVDDNLPALIEAFQSNERGMACSAADLLGRVGPPASDAIDALSARTRGGGDYHVRGAALNALRKIKDDDPLVDHKRPLTGGNLRGWRAKESAQEVSPERTDPRPNILWISCEDISPNLGCYGDGYASTPNLDRLARQGARFDRAFTPAGVCAVVRSGIITGVYPISIGSHHMRSRIVPPAEVKCFSEYLRAAGYFCTNNSKTDYQFDPPMTAWDRQGTNHGDWRARGEGQPFFSVINLTISHESQIRHSEQLHAQVLARLQPEQRHDPDKAAPYHPPIYPKTGSKPGSCENGKETVIIWKS